MIALRIIIGIITIIGVALLLGWTQKKVKSPGAQVAIWIGSILLLLTMRFWDSITVSHLTLLLTFFFLAVGSIPRFIIYGILGIVVFGFAEYRFRIMAAALLEIAVENERTNARIALMENSISHKLDDIASQLRKSDEPE